ncbi:zinc ribbon domain-containing protein [Christensenellaceae bacterium NSJ-63]|uniref:Zinc ribbon domain-containing protein n=1 Tax=Guopingia tenuis TaxID=2763656 RepID=A0A926HXM3_9FIRM|nr:zinc ribbon domain-containing protein [Guopingia tenuis]MBC8539210.1 zinc ribbon domain-containing protein [Guopingia tenuis]
MICTNCGKEIANGSAFCEYCGAKAEQQDIKEKAIYCEKCGASLPVAVSFCEKCGRAINQQEKTAVQPSTLKQGYEKKLSETKSLKFNKSLPDRKKLNSKKKRFIIIAISVIVLAACIGLIVMFSIHNTYVNNLKSATAINVLEKGDDGYEDNYYSLSEPFYEAINRVEQIDGVKSVQIKYTYFKSMGEFEHVLCTVSIEWDDGAKQKFELDFQTFDTEYMSPVLYSIVCNGNEVDSKNAIEFLLFNSIMPDANEITEPTPSPEPTPTPTPSPTPTLSESVKISSGEFGYDIDGDGENDVIEFSETDDEYNPMLVLTINQNKFVTDIPSSPMEFYAHEAYLCDVDRSDNLMDIVYVMAQDDGLLMYLFRYTKNMLIASEAIWQSGFISNLKTDGNGNLMYTATSYWDGGESKEELSQNVDNLSFLQQYEPTQDETISSIDNPLSKYLGDWVEENNRIQSVEDRRIEGGYILNVKEIGEDSISFTLECVQANDNRVAMIDITCPMEDKTGHFEFDDDGWGNHGKGHITLMENYILVGLEMPTDYSTDWALGYGKFGKGFQKAG